MAKVKEVKYKDKELGDIFSKLIGADDDVNMQIAYPKYQNIKKYIQTTIKLLESFAEIPQITTSAQKKQMLEYSRITKQRIPEIFKFSVSSSEIWNLNEISDERKATFKEEYDAVKKNKIVFDIVAICNKLISYKKYLSFEKDEDIQPWFITRTSENDVKPFEFSNFDMKGAYVRLYSAKISQNINGGENIAKKEKFCDDIAKLGVMNMSKLFKVSYDMYKCISSPDIDVEEFSEVIIKSIDNIKKVPQLSGCKDAFRKIKSSVGMLQDNFGEYYRDFIETKNSTIIMENFVLDVSKSSNASPQITRQFRKIISYYRSIAKDKIENPQLKSMFDSVSKKFNEISESAPNIGADQDANFISDSEESDAEEEQENEIFAEEREQNSKKSVDELMKDLNL